MKKILTPFALLIIIIGGCSGMNDSNQSEKNNTLDTNNEVENEKYDPKHYAPIQEYTGEGYTLEGAREETGEIANEHREEVDKAVKDFFENEYKTEVKIHNIVSAVDGVTVFVESIGEPHFYTFAIVPIDIKNEQVMGDSVWEQGGQIEIAIQSALFAMAYEDEINELDQFLENQTDEFPIVGTPLEVMEKVGGDGYMTPYYIINVSGDTSSQLLDTYLSNPDLSKQEIQEFLDGGDPEQEHINIAIKFYMADKSAEPEEQIYDEILSGIKEKEGFPPGEYYLDLHDNYILKEDANGNKDNTITKTILDGIVKE